MINTNSYKTKRVKLPKKCKDLRPIKQAMLFHTIIPDTNDFYKPLLLNAKNYSPESITAYSMLNTSHC